MASKYLDSKRLLADLVESFDMEGDGQLAASEMSRLLQAQGWQVVGFDARAILSLCVSPHSALCVVKACVCRTKIDRGI